ncbi:MAG: hypothetical protein P8J64_07505 [Dehalococcoidia bacterium]|jgi:hypothetical protein|nr:hypothetical protein [Dehalococcoidia bacterium]
MKIGIDFDDTLNDYRALLKDLVRERHHHDLKSGETLASTIGKEVSESLVKEVLETELSLRLAPRQNSIEVMQRLIKASHEFIILTARYDREIHYIDEWLSKHGLQANVYPTNREDKGPIAEELGLAFHLDDMISQINTFTVDHQTVPVLIAGGWMPTSLAGGDSNASKVSDRVAKVDDWLEFESLINTAT